jgi:hypothetical protein
MNLLLLAALLLQDAPGRASATADGKNFEFTGGEAKLTPRTLTIIAGPGRPGIRFKFESVDEGRTWTPLGIDQSVYLDNVRGGLVTALQLRIESTGKRFTASWSATLAEKVEGNEVQTALTGKVDLPQQGKGVEKETSTTKGGIFFFGAVIFLAALAASIVGGVFITLAGFKESPMWGWLCLPTLGPLALAMLYYGVGPGHPMTMFGIAMTLVGIAGSIAFSIRHWDVARFWFVTYISGTVIFAIVIAALILSQEKVKPRDPDRNKPFFDSDSNAPPKQ